jgi:hypothetical protein
MKIGTYIAYGILTFLVGILAVLFLVGIFNSSGGGELTSGIFNSGIMGIVAAILFLCSTIVTCTIVLINTIKNKK